MNKDRALVVIGTGLGKTTTALAYIRKYGMRALVLGPNNVITQAWDKESDVDTMTYQGFMNKYFAIDFSKYGVLICDEAHHCAAPRWGEGVRYVLDNKLAKVIGLTATPKEDKKEKANYEKSTNFFAGCVCKGFSVLDGIEREIIHDFSYVGAIYDTSGIKEKYADISDKTLLGELDLALNNTPTVKTIITKHMPSNKRKGIIFVSNIAAMDEAEEIMRDIYPNAEYRRMHSLMPDNEVRENREWFQNTDEGYLLAVNMISEGAHYKGVNTIIMFRRTQSSLVFNQQLGRIITLARDEDPHAIVFDLVNNATNLDAEKSFSGSLRESYGKRKARGGKEKSEQIIVEDYAEAISDVLRKITKSNEATPVFCMETKRIFSSITKVEKDLGILHSGIYGACIGEYHSSGGLHWKFYEEGDELKDWTEYILKIEEGRGKGGHPSKSVFCMDNCKIYSAIAEAERDTGAARQTIRKVCQGKQKTAGGLHWKFYEEGDELKDWTDFIMGVEGQRKHRGVSKRVMCIETEEIFESCAAADREKNIYRGGVSAVCTGAKKTAGDLHWKFIE
jgi:superfamily II DNA or RNA helicase